MARSDLLLTLVRAGTTGDTSLFRRSVEALIAEERAKKHEVLASQLSEQLHRNGNGGNYRNGNAHQGEGAVVQDLYYERVPQRSFADLILAENIEASLQELVEEHHRGDLLRSYNLQPRNRILLIGPPGNGKTSLAEATAHALSVPLIVVRYESLIGSYLGETASRLRRLFDYVRMRACVLFFDEFDTLGKERGDVHETGEIKRVVSSLLLQIDDLPSHVVVMTATNHPELLDRAVWRRFQVRLEIGPPSSDQTEQFLTRFLCDLGGSRSLSVRAIARKLAGSSYSELNDFVSDVARRYVLSLPEADVKRIVDRQLAQWEQRSRVARPKSLLRQPVHARTPVSAVSRTPASAPSQDPRPRRKTQPANPRTAKSTPR